MGTEAGISSHITSHLGMEQVMVVVMATIRVTAAVMHQLLSRVMLSNLVERGWVNRVIHNSNQAIMASLLRANLP